MELSLTLTPNPSSSSLVHFSNKLCEFHQRKKRVSFFDASRVVSLRCVKASAERTGEAIDDRGETRTGFTAPAAMEVTTFNQGFNDAAAADFPVWEKIGAVVRLSYGIGIYGAMAVAGVLYVLLPE
ncbi:unnamed protein product [Lathyrus sativus]|nr:unnamed protein product [Lathyrus sativus]